MTRGKRNDAPCLVEGCERPAFGNGACQMHYNRMRRHGSYGKAAMADRFWGRVQVAASGCMEWQGHRDVRGYGQTSVAGRMVGAHRVAYELARGLIIPDGLQLDHLCRNPPCVNPDHLEPVTARVNTLRGVGPTAVNAVKTHCDRGHEFTEENTRYKREGSVRVCRTCSRLFRT